MLHYKIQWKGYPHHHLPRIKLASTATSECRRAHKAAEDVVRLPFGLALEKARAQQVYKLRRRRKRSSRESTNLNRRRRVSLKARQDIDIHGWDSTCANLTTTASREGGIEYSQRPPPVCRSSSTNSKALPGCTDGASCGTLRMRKPTRLDSRYSLMQVPTPYFGDLPNHSGLGRTVELETGEYAHVAAINWVRKRNIHPRPRALERSRIYDPRVPTKISHMTYRKRLTPSSHAPSIHSRRSSMSSKKLREDKKPDAIRKGLRRGFNVTVSAVKSVASGVTSTALADLPLRSSSRQKALDRFSRGLEKHLIARQALRAASLATTATPSCVSASAHTIVDFMPYIDQFRANGLAVTSFDQQNYSPAKVTNLTSPPTPRKDSIYVKKTAQISGMPDADSERTTARDACSTASDATPSCTTVITFPPLIISPLLDEPARALESPVKKAAKKVLPWLRKGMESACSSDCGDDSVATSTTTVIDFLPERDAKKDKREERDCEVKPPFQTGRRGDIRWSHPAYSSSGSNLADERRTYSDNSPMARRSPSLSRTQPICPERPPPLGPCPGARTIKPVPARRSPLQQSRNLSISLNLGSRVPPETPPQRSVAQLPSASFSAPYDHENPSVFEETLDKIVNAVKESEGYFLKPKVAADVEIVLDPLPGSSDPVKRCPATPYTPLSHRQSQPAQSSKLEISPSHRTWETFSSDDAAISDRDVLKGLQVALAAACDDHIDEYIEETTGRSVRRMLANLSLLDPIGINELAVAARSTAWKRREVLRGVGVTLIGGTLERGEKNRETSKERDRYLGTLAAEERTDRAVERTR